MSEVSFWPKLSRPIIGLSPMDGVTDAVFRGLTKELSNPAVIFTEFVSVEGIARNAVALLAHWRYQAGERPVVAQVYGIEPASFRVAALIVAALGFDGIDINMGCPAKKVSRRGAGAALINNQPLAAEIIQAVKDGIQDWCNGQNVADLPLKIKMVQAIEKLATLSGVNLTRLDRQSIPVSVKTRVGYAEVQIKEWAHFLASQNLAAVTLHGRTLKQLYTGQANWQAIKQGAAIIKSESTALALGNGDVTTIGEAIAKAAKFGLDGVLIGRAAVGNPWIFGEHHPSHQELAAVVNEHARRYEKEYGSRGFAGFRRYLAAYIKGVKGASKLRSALMQANDATTVASILENGGGIVE